MEERTRSYDTLGPKLTNGNESATEQPNAGPTGGCGTAAVYGIGTIQLRGAEPQRIATRKEVTVMLHQATTTDVLKRLVDYVKLQRPDILRSLKDVASETKGADCVEPVVGRLIEVGGFDYLTKLLSLETDDEFKFVLDLQGETSIDRTERQALLETVQKHHAECQLCQDRARHELLFFEQFDTVCDRPENRRPKREPLFTQLKFW